MKILEQNTRLADFVNEGKYAKYLTKSKKARQAAAPANKEYREQFKMLKQKLSEINKVIDRHIKMQQSNPLEYKFVGEIQDYNDKLDDIILSIKKSTGAP